MKNIFNYGEDRLTASAALKIATGKLEGCLSDTARQKVTASRQAVDDIVERGKVVYGINTGFGSLCNKIISKENTRKLQDNILRSHSVGVGDAIEPTIAKLMMIIKVQALSQGYSGISPEVLDRIIWHINTDIIPEVPSQGSLGASGDLAPLAHLFLPLIGLGKVYQDGALKDSAAVLQQFNLSPINLGAKEGLALINGTQFIAAHGVKALERLHNCLETADIIGAMSLEGLLGSAAPFDEALHQLRPFRGNLHVAHRLRTLLHNSEMVASHKDCGRVQDPYSLRCMPQVHGTSRNAWLHLKELLEIELNAVTDNPIVFNADKTVSGGNFHGQPLALPLDYAALAAAEIGNISDRRIYLLLEGGVNGLPELLMHDTGINSGFMIPQYTSAALVSENKGLCFPASADSIPSSLGQEDHVSMGSISGRKANQILGNLENILAVELLCAAQAFDYRKPMKSSKLLDACHELVRSRIEHAEEDRIFAEDIHILNQIIRKKELLHLTEEVAQNENINLHGPYYEDFGIY
ncbi:histidine ammonia-lyase [Nafulsella turpanensis]|uniref:histidine ammonia-lyase n=1 Tax=Nafulsella turpanensis TaxID=1265690 RepID=UPI000348512F|nr:histidine ammonia-lyase [Nafulsella turpanensis]